MLYLRQLNLDEVHPKKVKQIKKEKVKMENENKIEETQVQDTQENAVVSPEAEEIDLVAAKANAVAKVEHAKEALAVAKAELKAIRTKIKENKPSKPQKVRTKGFCSAKPADVILATLQEMGKPAHIKELVEKMIATKRYIGSRNGLASRTSLVLGSLVNVGIVTKEGNRRSAIFSIKEEV